MKGEISLSLTAGTELQQSTVFITFTIVRIPSAYNVILERPKLNALRAVVLTYHLLARFPTRHGVGEMHGDQQLVRCCFLVSTQNNKPEDSLPVDKLDQRENQERGKPAEQLIFILLKEEDPKKTV